jgi:type II secretory pathway pseudopilin PulG
MFIKSTLQSLGQRGDTIVEVLMAIAVIGAVLGGAFVTTNKSLQATRDAQERGDATKLVESQIEQLKQLVAQDSSAIFGSSAPTSGFCVYQGATQLISSTKCDVDSTGAPSSTEPVYHLSIARSTNAFTITNTWAHVGSGTTNNVTMSYKLYAQ